MTHDHDNRLDHNGLVSTLLFIRHPNWNGNDSMPEHSANGYKQGLRIIDDIVDFLLLENHMWPTT